MTTHQFLVEARNYIDKHGWWQHDFHGPNGAVCARGAFIELRRASLSLERQEPLSRELLRDAYEALFDQIPVQIRESIGDQGKATSIAVIIARYNDAICRSKEDALAWFDRAIAATAPVPEDVKLEAVEEKEKVYA